MNANQAIHWSCGGKPVWALPYGEEPADLRLPLADEARPWTVTRLLSHCLRDSEGRFIDEEDVWSWNLTHRLQGLLAVAAASLGRTQAVEARCRNPDCGEGLDLDVDLADFCDRQAPETVSCEPAAGYSLRLRVPTGADQIAWLRRWPFQLPQWSELVATLVETVNGEPPPPDWQPASNWLDVLGAAFAEADWLTDLQLDSVCVDCGESVTVELDMEGYVLQRLQHRQEALLDEVHVLASAYHWNETEIFGLPAERRRAYLRRLDGEGW